MIMEESAETTQEANSRYKLLTDARKAVSRIEYGGPEDSFQRIANLWNDWMAERSKSIGEGFGPDDVAVMLMLVKIARLMSQVGHYDSIVDIAGYAACLAEIVEEQ